MRRALVLALLAACGSSPAPPPSPMPDMAIDAPSAPARLVLYAAGNSPDIGWYSISAAAIAPIASVPTFAANPSFLAVAPNGKFAYAIAESADRIGAYAIDPADGALTFINDVDVGGSGPAHVSVDRTSSFVFAANYSDGSISVFPIDSDGRIGPATQTLTAGANAHQIITDPANKFVFVPCLGSDYVAQYELANGTLTPNAVPHLATKAGAGPRHLAFAPDGKHAVLINELDSTLTALAYDATAGRLTALATVSTLETPVSGNSGAEVAVHPSGKFVYGSNRGDNSIVTMSYDGTALVPIGWTKTGGMTPRHFSLSPDGTLLVVGNQGSNTIQPMTIDATGIPKAVGAPLPFTKPELTLIATLPAVSAARAPHRALPGPPPNASLIDQPSRDGAAGRWTEALAGARRGLEQVHEGTDRSRLIEIAGVAGCKLRDAATARRYHALASPGVKKAIEEACRRERIDPRR